MQQICQLGSEKHELRSNEINEFNAAIEAGRKSAQTQGIK